MDFEGAVPTTPIKSGSSGTPQTPVGPAHPSGTGVGAENSQLQAESGNEEDPSVILPSPGEKRPAPLEKNAPEDSLSSERLLQIKQANGKYTETHPWSLFRVKAEDVDTKGFPKQVKLPFKLGGGDSGEVKFRLVCRCTCEVGGKRKHCNQMVCCSKKSSQLSKSGVLAIQPRNMMECVSASRTPGLGASLARSGAALRHSSGG